MRTCAVIAAITIAIAASGCTTMDTSGVIEAEPVAFPHPGIFSGEVINGIVTYKINADGRGLSCFRNKFSGDMFYGDLKYDGDHIYTEDGTVSVESVSEDLVEVSAVLTTAELHRVNEAPTVCQDFFAKD